MKELLFFDSFLQMICGKDERRRWLRRLRHGHNLLAKPAKIRWAVIETSNSDAKMVLWENRLDISNLSKKIPAKIKVGPKPPLFKNESAVALDCLVLVYDFEKFTDFFSVPDIQRDIAKYLNFVDSQMRMIWLGGTQLWDTEPSAPLDVTQLHEKFLGDGMMYILRLDKKSVNGQASTAKTLCNRAWNIKDEFPAINSAAVKFMPVADLPKRIRIGVTYGQALQLTRSDGNTEYIGFALNLAARLQKYSASASFLASARLPNADDWLPEHDYVKVRAKKLRSRPGELVYIDKDDLELTKKTKGEKHLFEEV